MIPSIAEPRTPRVGPGCSLAARFFFTNADVFPKGLPGCGCDGIPYLTHLNTSLDIMILVFFLT